MIYACSFMTYANFITQFIERFRVILKMIRSMEIRKRKSVLQKVVEAKFYDMSKNHIN